MDPPAFLTARLVPVLDEARARGFLGPGPVEAHVAHALGFAAVIEPVVPDVALDLGSGGGLPGLVLALVWPSATWVLLDAGQRRTAFLSEAVAALDLGDRVTVERARAEECGRHPDRRARFDLVTARSFGPPAVVAECAAPFLRVGGLLVVSGPPEAADDRWPAEGVALVGLASRRPGVVTGTAHFEVLEQGSPCPDRFPRRVGVAAKRPLF